jgi:hypothetical protein
MQDLFEGAGDGIKSSRFKGEMKASEYYPRTAGAGKRKEAEFGV